MKGKLLIILIALSLGIADYFLGGAVSLSIIFGVIVYFIYKNSSPADRRFIVTVLITGFLLRVGLMVLFHSANFIKGYHGISGDDLLYTVKSWALAYQWEGKPYVWVEDLAGSSPKYGLNPFVYLLAAYYKFFGFHPVTAKFVNCMIGSFMGYFSYLIAKDMFDCKAARISMLIVTFFPSIMRWSIANLKDPMIMLLFMVCMYVLVFALNHKITVWKLFMLFMSIALLYFFTPGLYFILISAGSCLLIIFRLVRLFANKRYKVLAASAAVLGFLACVFFFTHIYPKAFINLIYECELKQALMAKSDFASYYFYSEEFMRNLSKGIVLLPEFLAIIFKNIVYFMLTPFPWQITSAERLLSFPQMILWYALLVLSVFGFGKLIAQKPATGLLLGALLTVGIAASAIAEGNIGSAFRHRDIFSPLFVVLASAIVSDLISDRALRCKA